MSRWGDTPITGAIGPNSPFKPNQTIYVPGIGPVKLSDYGPRVSGIDIPVSTRREMLSDLVNRGVNINGRNIRLTGYIPGNSRLDPQGGGNLDAYGNPIVRLGDNIDYSVPEATPPQGYPFTGEPPPEASQLDYPGFNVPPNENMYPVPVVPYNPPPPESYDYPTPIISLPNPAPYGPSDYPTPVENPIFNPAPVESGGYPGPIDFSNPAPNENANYPTSIDFNNPPPSEGTDYPTPVDFNNPSPTEDTSYPTPVDFNNPAPNEDMVASPVDTYLPSGGGTVPSGGGVEAPVPVPVGGGNTPMYVDTTGVPVSPLSARPGDINLGGFGEPMGYFNSPTYYTGGPPPLGAYGVGGGGGSFFGGPGNLAMSLPGSFANIGGGGGDLGHMGNALAAQAFKHLLNSPESDAQAYAWMKFQSNNGFGLTNPMYANMPTFNEYMNAWNNIRANGLPNPNFMLQPTNSGNLQGGGRPMLKNT